MFQVGNKIFLLCILVQSALSACWGELQLVRTGTFTPIVSLMTASTNATTLSITYTTVINTTATVSWGLALAGYDIYLTQNMAFKVTVDSCNTVAMQVKVQPEELTYVYLMRMNYIVSGLNATSSPPMQILNSCYKLLSLDILNSSLVATSRTQNFTQNSSMPNNPTIQIRSFLYSFNLTNMQGKLNYLKLQTTLSGGVYTHIFVVEEYNILNYACLTVIAWDSATNSFGAGIAGYFQTYQLNPTNRTSQVIYYSAFDCSNLFFMGLSFISHQMGGQRILGVHPETYSQISTNFNYNAYLVSAKLNIFYLGNLVCNLTASEVYNQTGLTCVANCTALTQANISNKCVPCNQFCLTCDSADQNLCISCYAGTNRNGNSCNCSGLYFANGTNTNCLVCSAYLLYCVQCVNQTVCTLCDADKFLVNNTCWCFNNSAPSYYVTGVCLTYPGCIDAVSVINANYCRTCNSTAKFQPVSASNLSCTCMTGYSNAVNSLICSAICGNGVISGQACDDNNTANLDGCNQNCTVETGWFCYSTTSGSKSTCVLANYTVSITYLYAERILGTNTAKLYFQFSPAGMNLSASSLQGGVTSNAPLASISTTYDGGNSRFTLLVSFTSNMQASSYAFTFNFTNAQTFYVEPITATAKTNGINQPLIIENYLAFQNAASYVFIALAFLGLILGLVSSIFGYKLMGLQLLLPLQASFFSLFCMPNTPPYLSSLKKLKYSNGFNNIFPYNYDQFYLSNSKFPKFDYEVEMGLNLNVMTGLLLFSTLILLILQLIYLCYHSRASAEQKSHVAVVQQPKKHAKAKKEQSVQFEVREQGEIGLKMKSARQSRNKYVNNFYFFLAVGLAQGAIFAFVAQNMQVSVTYMVISEDLNLSMGYITLILIVGNIVFLLVQLQERKQRRIVTFTQTRIYKYPVFLVCSYLLLALVISLFHTYSLSLYLSTIMSIVPLIGLIYFRPYRHAQSIVNIISAGIDLLFLAVCCFVYLVNQVVALSEFSCVISTAVILILLVVAEALTIIRLVIIVPWREFSLFQRCLKKDKKKDEGVLLDKNKAEIQMSSFVKNSIKGEGQKIVNWQQKNKKDYQSINSKGKEEEAQNSEQVEQQEDELAQLKRRLKKQIQTKRAF